MPWAYFSLARTIGAYVGRRTRGIGREKSEGRLTSESGTASNYLQNRFSRLRQGHVYWVVDFPLSCKGYELSVGICSVIATIK
jgi:hypothetical protein